MDAEVASRPPVAVPERAPVPDGRVEYDAVIVGGASCGASLALLLGLRGHRVLLIDRDEFPSDTLSTHLMGPYATPLLRKIGVPQGCRGHRLAPD